MEQTENIQTPISPVNNVQNPHFSTKKLMIGIGFILALATVFVLGRYSNGSIVKTENTTSTIVTPNDGMSGWKSYNNVEYGVSFKYPATWTTKNESTLVTDKGNLFSVFNPVNDSSWLSLCDALLSEESISVGMLSATKAIKSNSGDCDLGPDFVEYISTKITFENKYGVIFNFKKADQKESNVVLDQILSTFKFIEKTTSEEDVFNITIRTIEHSTIPEWETYSNEYNGLTFQYPPLKHRH